MEPKHIHHHYFSEVLTDFDERMRASILGRPDFEEPFPDIRGRFEPYMGWLDHPEMLLLRFEEFVTHREEVIARVLKHAVDRGFQLACEWEAATQILSQSIDPHRSPTFRSGKIGDWQTQFTEEHKHLFKEVAGDLLIRLGYERHNDW
jgi:hypothetical protein